MTTKPSYKIAPMSPDHVRWAIRDILKDPEGPLKGMRMPEALSGGKPDAQAVVELLSSCGIRRGAKEFFARILENGDDDAKLVDRHIGKYRGGEQNLAAKSLIRIIVVNTKEEKPDIDVETAFFACIEAAGKIREKDGILALSFLEFCGSSALGSESLKKAAQYCQREEVVEAAVEVKNSTAENIDSVLCEFFLAMRQISCMDEDEAEGTLRFFLGACRCAAGECPKALHSFLFHFSNLLQEGVEECLFYVGLWKRPGVAQALAGMGADYGLVEELTYECLLMAKAASKLAWEGCDEIKGALDLFDSAMGRLDENCPLAVLPFATYFRTLLENGNLGGVRKLAGEFTSEANMGVLGKLGGDPGLQQAVMKACFDSAAGILN